MLAMKVPSPVRLYGLAIIASCIALAVALPLDAPSSCFALAVIVSSVYGGRGPGLLAIVLTSIAFDYFFLPPQRVLIVKPESLPRFVAFLGAVLTIAWIIETRRRTSAALAKAFEEIRRSEQQLREVVNAIPTLAWSVRPDGSADFFNQKWLDFTGLSAKDALNWGWTAIIHPDDRDRLMQHWQRILTAETHAEIEARLRRVDGEYRWFLFRVNPWRDESGAIVRWYGTNTDIEDRKRAEEAVRASEQDLRLIVDSIPGMIWTNTPAGELEFASQPVRVYTGKTLDELKHWDSLIHPDERHRVTTAWLHSLATGVPLDAEFRLRRADGSYCWFRARVVAQYTVSGRISRWYGLMTDISSERSANEALLDTQARLSQATQLATISELAASIAHEINQPLAAVVANGHACLRWLAAGPPALDKAREAAERIVRDGKDAGEVVRRIRALFKKGTFENTPVDLNQIIGEVLSLLAVEMSKRHVALTTCLQQDLPLVEGDRVQLQQLLLNLLLNGIEALNAVPEGSRRLMVRSTLQAGCVAQIEINDSGVGLQNPDKVFEAFFTTKENGLGMGLTLCRSIIEAHLGRLWAVSPGCGTSFFFTLPALEARS